MDMPVSQLSPVQASSLSTPVCPSFPAGQGPHVPSWILSPTKGRTRGLAEETLFSRGIWAFSSACRVVSALPAPPHLVLALRSGTVFLSPFHR